MGKLNKDSNRGDHAFSRLRYCSCQPLCKRGQAKASHLKWFLLREPTPLDGSSFSPVLRCEASGQLSSLLCRSTS